MRYVLALTVTLTCAMTTGGQAAPAAPIIGNWVGNGIVLTKTGRKESVRCRIRYSKASARTYGFSATCASLAGTKSGRGRLVRAKGDRYSGRLYDAEHSVAGRIVVTVRGNRQTLKVTGDRGTGRLTLTRR